MLLPDAIVLPVFELFACIPWFGTKERKHAAAKGIDVRFRTEVQ